ncbi:MAG: PEBP family protein [Hyphomicrobiaceae bacterium]
MKRAWQFAVLAVAATGLVAGCNDRPGNDGRVLNERVVEGSGGTKVVAEVWVDNWFSLAVNGRPLIEDSVAYKTERSFNAERVTFNAEFPMTIAFEFRDFVENDTGLEYIGSNRQQIGDGGAIAQFINAQTGAIIKVTDTSWKCRVIHHAPVDAACAKERDPKVGEGSCGAEIIDAPAGWKGHGFDDSQWTSATEHSSSDVRPKDGYDEINWDSGAKLIWSKDLKLDNTVLCRTVIPGR